MTSAWPTGSAWILDAVVDAPVKLARLMQPDVTTVVHRQAHALSIPERLAALEHLVDTGSVEVVEDDRVVERGRWIETAPADRKELRSPRQYVGLTVLGGQVWEAAFAPQWERFVHWDPDLVQGETSEPHAATAVNGELLLSWVGMATTVLSNFEIVAWEEVSPWHPTYWKTLPHAHRVLFRGANRDWAARLEPWRDPTFPRPVSQLRYGSNSPFSGSVRSTCRTR